MSLYQNYTMILCAVVDAIINGVPLDNFFLFFFFLFLTVLFLLFLSERKWRFKFNKSNKILLVLLVCIILPVEYIFAGILFRVVKKKNPQKSHLLEPAKI